MNFLRGRLERGSGGACIDLGEGVPLLALPAGRALNGAADGATGHPGPPAGACRARRRGRRRRPDIARVEATIELVQPTGSRSYATFRLAASPLSPSSRPMTWAGLASRSRSTSTYGAPRYSIPRQARHCEGGTQKQS